MKIFNRFCSIILIFTIAVFIISLSQNMIFRSEMVYSFYFNDSRAVDGIYTSLSSNEMAGEIAGFMNSWNPEKFEVLEFTGYDHESVFTEEEGQNMMAVKRALDISAIVCVVSLILTVSIYAHFIRDGKKKVLSDMFKISMVMTLLMAGAEMLVMATNQGRDRIFKYVGITPMGEESQLLELLGVDFLNMAAIFLIMMTVIVTAVAIYVNYLVTKPPRLFY
ncbi:MAG: DUF1461 domain-containing protein [Firmicutes bacterium]|nr:DUF1461 domain-containing protein [Bacillota bacterium]MBR3707140.1 DUF1461 domain-containing protein [Bacillota bacterium]MBR6585084.1 DUF1461 domain-containing protein [Bacillota bacterium]